MTNASPASRPHLTRVERRSFPRFDVALAGLCSINLGPDSPCDTIDLSIAGIALRTKAPGAVGDSIIASFREFGMAKGRVVRRFDGGFALALNTIDPYRSRLSQYLAWRMRGRDGRVAEVRLEDRLVPLNRLLMLTRADGRTSIGRVENVSRSGIFFTTTGAFAVGERLRIGTHPATVVRLVEGGVAAKFESALAAETFDAMVSFASAG